MTPVCRQVRSRPGTTWRDSQWIRPKAIPDDHGPARGAGQALAEPPHGVLVEIIDDGSAGTPVVKGDLYAAEGHGLFLVQHLAAQWGYLRDPAGTTVWFHLPAADQSQRTAVPADPQADAQADRRPSRPDHARPTQLWAAAIQPTPA
jgi:hypothetical protein